MRRPPSPSSGNVPNTVWALLAEGVQFTVGFAVFFLLIDRLGPVESGLYGALLAVAVFGVPVTSLGVQPLLMRGIAAGEPFDELWTKSLQTILGATIVTTAVAALLVRPWLLPEVSLASFALVFAAQVGLYATSELGVVAAQAHRRLSIAFVVRSCSAVFRLSAVGHFALSGFSTLESWAPYAFVSQGASAAASLLIVRRAFGPRAPGVSVTVGRLRRGAVFAFGRGSAQVLDALDRPMLVRLGPDPAEAGLYNAGYRLTQMALMPIGALVRSSDADMYSAGAHSTRRATLVAMQMARRASLYAVLAGIVLIVVSPIVPAVLGTEWEDAAPVLRYLSVLPLIKALQVFAANALTSSGLQVIRNRVLVAAILVNAALNLWLIPLNGWRGAAIATLVAEVLMTALLWVVLLVRRDAEGSAT